MKYNPALDGLRAASVMMVVAFHCATPRFLGGYIGVEVFFVLSGFLITTLILEQDKSPAGFSYWNFYKRRFFRLTPPLALLLALYLATAWIWPTGYEVHLRDSAIAITYLADYARAFWGMPVVLRHAWSLAIEEHFYLIWPVMLLGLAKSRGTLKLAMTIALLACLATVWRQYELLFYGFKNVYYRLDTHASGLLIGACTACISMRFKINDRFLGAAAICAALYITAGMIEYRWLNIFVLAKELTKVEIASAVIILSLAQSQNSDMYRLLSFRPIAYIGKLSYGIYLYNFPIALYLKQTIRMEYVLLTTTALSIALAALSYHTVEAYFRKARRSSAIHASEIAPTA